MEGDTVGMDVGLMEGMVVGLLVGEHWPAAFAALQFVIGHIVGLAGLHRWAAPTWSVSDVPNILSHGDKSKHEA